MPHIEFAPALQRHVHCPARTVNATTLADALRAVFADTPVLQGYVMDDQGHVRRHVAVFINGELMHDRRNLAIDLAATDRIFVVQALSGG